jgi:hypothetical protein
VLTTLLGLVALLLLGGVALADGPPAADWDVIGGGGGHAEAGIYTLDGTIGQPVVGPAEGTGYELCSGFWCGAAVEHNLYLPLILKNA